MCCDNTLKAIFPAFWKKAVQTYGKSHPLISETTVATYGYSSTAY